MYNPPMPDPQFARIETIYRALTLPAQTADPPTLIAISGLPGTGKSFLARHLAARVPCVIVESDFVRKTLIPQPTYTSAESDLIHQVAHAVIARLLHAHSRVISDATNLAEWHRERLHQLARQADAKFLIVHTTAPDDIVQARLRQRFAARDPRDLSDADWNVHLLLKREMEPIRAPHFVVDTRGEIDAALAEILAALNEPRV
ncbi:MAG: AAA family ATPase [Chloroflexi bacterium]|nr:AAA family ATPase [Chloroflexota bacterium]